MANDPARGAERPDVGSRPPSGRGPRALRALPDCPGRERAPSVARVRSAYRDLAAERRHTMGFFAFAGIVIVALVVGFAVQMYDKRALSYEWLIIAIAGTFGAYFASENFPGATVPLLEGITDWGPTLDGMYVIPATVTGLILAG